MTVRLSQVKRGINAYLQPGAIITGTVTAKSDGARLRGICVTTTDGFSLSVTGSDGTYAIDQLSTGQAQVQFFNCANSGSFAPQIYPDQLDPAKAVSIKVRSGQVVKGIDAVLVAGATISGAIRLTSGANPSKVCVEADPVARRRQSRRRHRGHPTRSLRGNGPASRPRTRSSTCPAAGRTSPTRGSAPLVT